MRRAFLDSSAIYALADRNDTDHENVLGFYRERATEYLTHEVILLEAFSLIAKRLHKEAAIDWIDALKRSPRLNIVPPSPELIERGWQRCARFADKEWDWIDCISFEFMEANRLRDALSLDHHFAQAGFKLLV
jgi:predicted nucleic acid-binding protein